MVLAHVELGSGRDIELSELHLKSTYGGLIEGYPMARLNDMIVAGLAKQAGRFDWGPVKWSTHRGSVRPTVRAWM